ncbi:MAG: hypothetical protein R2867_32405 [Caldilineaceae bacterium]
MRSFGNYFDSETIKENCEFEHIRKIALVEVARRKIPNARDIAYAHLDWRSYSKWGWPSEKHAGAAVIEALGWFDDQESQQYIIDQWINNIDFPTGEACSNALIRIADRGCLSENIKKILLELLSKDLTDNQSSPNIVPVNSKRTSYWMLDQTFITIHDVDLALQLIPILAEIENSSLQSFEIRRILKTFNEPEIIYELIQQIDNYKNDPSLCALFLDVLSEIEGEIPIETFWNFAQDKLPTTTKAFAIRGLGRLPFDEIREIVLAAIHLPQHNELLEIINEYQIDKVSRTHRDNEVFQALADLSNLPNMTDSSRAFLHRLLAQTNNVPELLRSLTREEVPNDVRWNIEDNCEHLSSKLLQEAILHLLSPLPDDYLLTNNSPCDYANVQQEIFRVLAKHGQIALLARPENSPQFLYNTSSEVLFEIIRRDTVYEMESSILSLVEKRLSDRQIHTTRMVVEAAWVLADLGNTPKAQDVINHTPNVK